LDVLCDPATHEPFDLEVFESRELEREVHLSSIPCRRWCYRKRSSIDKVGRDDCEKCYNEEIISGRLITKKSANEFPIIEGVPRILSGELLETVLARHRSFLFEYGGRFDADMTVGSKNDKRVLDTSRAFGFQWTTFLDNYSYFPEIFLSFTRPYLNEADFRDKLMLEVGCGSGRPAVAACGFGAEIVAMDLSAGVESAFQQSKHHPRLHVVQANAYDPPFLADFDAIYSVGVLQHIDDPKRALKGINKAMSDRSPLILWVYGKRELWYQPIEWLRKLTVKLPYSSLKGLSFVLAGLSELFLLGPYRLLSKWSSTKGLAEKIPGRIYAKFPFRENAIGWFDRLVAPVTYYFSKDELETMLQECGYKNVEIHSRKEASASWVVRAERR
jgi:SAM-dependent methyltransferase/uncharacterized protein YbaR (Trm112 family)